MIKYLGSKRLLVEHIVSLCTALRPDRCSVLDLFSGTSRVGHALKHAGFGVLANDHNSFAHTLALCYIQAHGPRIERDAQRIIDELNTLPGRDGPFTRSYSVESRYFHPDNARRIEAMRDRVESLDLEPELRAVVLTSLIEGADRVDSTTGVQMAYLKSWAPRALKPIELRLPRVLANPEGMSCRAFGLDALEAAHGLSADIAYLDPPYNQHSYLGNYHVWESLVRWDHPETYGVARKRVDCKQRKSDFNSKVRIHDALRRVIDAVDAPTLIVSFNNEGYLTREQIEAMLNPLGPVAVIDHDHPRYVGCRIGIHNRRGEKVGRVGRLRNTEHFFIAGEGAERFIETGGAVAVAG